MAFSDPEPGPGVVASVTGVGMGCLFFIALLFPLLIVEGMGHCVPAEPCGRGLGGELLLWALLALGPAVLLGAALRRLFSWLGGRITAQETATDAEAQARARTPWWALAALPAAIGGGTWLVWGEPLWSSGSAQA